MPSYGPNMIFPPYPDKPEPPDDDYGDEPLVDLTAIYREDATEEEQVSAYQQLIDSGAAWSLEGHVGRTAMSLIDSGHCILGPVPHLDYYGNRIPSRHEVEPGTLGSIEYAEDTGNYLS